jgi:hypothetical protein
MIHIGIDPGAVGAAVAMDDADGKVLAAVRWDGKKVWRVDDDDETAWWPCARESLSTMVDALCLLAELVLAKGGQWHIRLVVEDVGLRAGKGVPIALATNAGIAIGVVSAVLCVDSLQRPRPEAWRKVLTGKALAGRRAELKALALCWARGDAYPGISVDLHPGGRVLPDGPDHAAEAALMAWASVRGVV